jgi:hypothetical protein
MTPSTSTAPSTPGKGAHDGLWAVQGLLGLASRRGAETP